MLKYKHTKKKKKKRGGEGGRWNGGAGAWGQYVQFVPERGTELYYDINNTVAVQTDSVHGYHVFLGTDRRAEAETKLGSAKRPCSSLAARFCCC